MTVRAKFRCNSVTFHGDHTDPNVGRRYNLTAVYDHSTEENRRFTKATPWAELNMTVDNPAAVLEVGQEYYLDFTPCAEANALGEETVEDYSRDV
jgi:hypothetical protein